MAEKKPLGLRKMAACVESKAMLLAERAKLEDDPTKKTEMMDLSRAMYIEAMTLRDMAVKLGGLVPELV